MYNIVYALCKKFFVQINFEFEFEYRVYTMFIATDYFLHFKDTIKIVHII